MSIPLPPRQISLAVGAGVLLVAGAWFLKPDVAADTTGLVAREDAIQVTRPAGRPYIDIIDTDNNGVPDWQEALQRTDPLEVGDTTTTYETPDTLTGQFALEFFEEYVRGQQYGDFGTSPEELLRQSSELMADQAKDEPITRSEIRTSTDVSQAALTAYGEQVAIIVVQHSLSDREGELTILNRAIRQNNSSELEKLDPVIAVYENIIAEVVQLPVPASMVNEHLIFINAHQAVLNDIKAMRTLFEDPLYTLLRIKRYQDDLTGLNNAIIKLYESLIAGGADWNQNSPVFQFIDIR